MPSARHQQYRGPTQCRRIRVRSGLKIATLLALACLTGCARRHNPQVVFDDVLQTYEHGDMPTAEVKAGRGYEEFHRASATWGWRFAILRGRALYGQGFYRRTIELLDSELAPLPSGDLLVQKQRLEAVAYASLHNFAQAAHNLEEAERQCAALAYAVCADVARARGFLEMQRGQYVPAQKHFERALAASRQSGDVYLEAVASLNLSWAADHQTHFDEAIDWADGALQIALPRGFAGIAQSALGNKGWAYYKLGDSAQAEQATIKAWDEAKKLGLRADEVRWLTNAGLFDLDSGKVSDAERRFKEALNTANQIDSREEIINAQIALAFVSEQTGKLDDAKRYADQALAMAEKENNGRDRVYPRLVQGRLAARAHDSATAENTFREVAQSPDCPVFIKWEAERSLARLYEDENQRASAEREYRAALNTFEAARSQIHEDSRLAFLSNAARIYDDYIHFLVAQGKKDEALRVADYSRGRTLAEGLGLLKETSFKPAALDAPAIVRRAGGVILFYWLGEKQSYLWAITPQRTSLFKLPPGAEIDGAVQRYREALAGPQDVLASADRDGQWLYRMLIAPAQALLKKDAKVFVIPDGSLNNLNFETLLVSEAKLPETKLLATNPSAPKLHYWIEDVTIACASSLRILGAAGADKEKRDRTLLLVGNSIAPSDKYPQLPQAAAQMESVARRFPAAAEKILTQRAATPKAYLDGNPERFSYIHFVAHGTASRLSPLDSAIVLSKSSAEDDSFKLYARDIIHHPLRAELVTISACYSSGERSYSGEGLVGLSWAFLRAGAHNVIAALWEATDSSTELLMDKFYDELQKGKGPDAALRAAKLSLLHNSGFHNPFYWAPFQLYARLG
jgi:CHAT domain-containing protein